MDNNSNVVHPVHYADACSLECWDVMDLTFGSYNHFYYCLQNAFKYLWRYKFKNEEEDVKKAYQYIMRAKAIRDRECSDENPSVYFSDDENQRLGKLYDMYVTASNLYANEKRE